LETKEKKDGAPAKMISEIERLDVREGAEWEVVPIKEPKPKIKGHSLAALQISATDILVFGSYVKQTSPVFGEILYYLFDHDKLTIRQVTR